MTRKLILAIVVAVGLVTLFSTAEAGLDEGLAAYLRDDYETALREWRPLAEQGDAVAQNELGSMYENGWGMPQDYVEAVRWWRKAAEQGHADAQYILGFMYTMGWSGAQDYVHRLWTVGIAGGTEMTGLGQCRCHRPAVVLGGAA